MQGWTLCQIRVRSSCAAMMEKRSLFPASNSCVTPPLIYIRVAWSFRLWNFSSRDQQSETKTSVVRKITTSTPRAARALSRCMPLWMHAVGNRITTALTARWACVWCRRLMPCIGLPNPANLNALHDSSAIRMCVFCLCFCLFVCFSVSSTVIYCA